jgi:hypothetical protein
VSPKLWEILEGEPMTALRNRLTQAEKRIAEGKQSPEKQATDVREVASMNELMSTPPQSRAEFWFRQNIRGYNDYATSTKPEMKTALDAMKRDAVWRFLDAKKAKSIPREALAEVLDKNPDLAKMLEKPTKVETGRRTEVIAPVEPTPAVAPVKSAGRTGDTIGTEEMIRSSLPKKRVAELVAKGVLPPTPSAGRTGKKAKPAAAPPPAVRTEKLSVSPEGRLVDVPVLAPGRTYTVAASHPELMASPGDKLTYVGEFNGRAQFRAENGSLVKTGVTAEEIAPALSPEGEKSLPFFEGAKQFLKGESGEVNYSQLGEEAKRVIDFFRPPASRPRFPNGYWAKRGGEIVNLEDMARHDNLPGPGGLAGLLKKGDVRGRGANVEVGASPDPSALRAALEEASRYGKEVHVDTTGTSATYDSEGLAEVGFNLNRARPLQQWRKEL